MIIISIINAILEEKGKATGFEGDVTNKTVWTCLYACYLCTNFCSFVRFLVVYCKKLLCFFRIHNCVCKFDKNKNKNLF